MSINEYQINKLRGSTRPFEKAIIEYICLDTFVYIPNRKTLLSRPWLTILLDDYSKKVLAFYLSLNGPSYISNMMVIRECVKSHSRLPETLLMNNGKEFKSDEFNNLLALFGTTVQFYPSPIRFESNDLSGIVNNFVRNEIEREESFWSMGNLKKSLSMLLYEVYDRKNHQALGTSPREIFQSTSYRIGKYGTRLIRYDNEFKLLTYPIVERKVIEGRGIKNNNLYYWTIEFLQPTFNGKKVKVKFDPVDLDIAFVCINGSWKNLDRTSNFIEPRKKVRSININD